MKIEMGENLFYSWLRHVKECQIVQTNWKVSPQWTLQHEDDLQSLMEITDKHFNLKYGYKVFKQNSSLSQILQQGECDALGIAIQEGENKVYAVDVAFHEAGLCYGSRDVTVMKVIAKTVRTAMCLWGYLGMKNAEIIFASPKINPAVLADIEPCIIEVNDIFMQQGFEFNARLIANEKFNDSVLQPILLVSDNIADTTELFLRAYQMFTMFSDVPILTQKTTNTTSTVKVSRRTKTSIDMDYVDEGIYKELKIGKLAQIVFRKLLEDGKASEGEIRFMQQASYSKQYFDLQYPVLVKVDADYDSVRYYKTPLIIRNEKYKMCSQWFETIANNDRPYLIKWIEEHSK